MLAIVLFAIGLALVTTSVMTFLTKSVIVYAAVQMYCNDKLDIFKVNFKAYYYGIPLSIGIGLIYFFGGLAKTHILLSI